MIVWQSRNIFFSVAVAFLAGCGGRVANPIKTSNVLDDKLSCSHLAAEHDVNFLRALELAGERKSASANNLGMLVLSPFLLNLNDSERKEIIALSERNKYIEEIAMRRSCPITSGSKIDLPKNQRKAK
jgi:hypothetical protein